MCSRRRITYTETCSVAPAVSFRVAAPIRISIASPSASVACTVLPAMRIATDRPLQHTRNERLRHWGGSLGSIPSVSPLRSRPAKPRITACHSAPSPAMRTPPALLGSRSRSSGRGLAQIAQRHLRIAQARGDQLRASPR